MNKIRLKGVIKDIEYSHNIQDVEYYKANIITEQQNGVEYIVPIKFKRFCNKYENDQKIVLEGNLRSYSTKNEEKNHVRIYVFTYLDEVEDDGEINSFSIDGRICKKSPLIINREGKCSISFIIANNIEMDNGKHLNSYLPCLAFGTTAKEINKLKVSDKIQIGGYIRSRQYKKKTSEDDYNIEVTHELVVKEITILE